MTKQAKLGGTFTLPGTSISLYRMGYGSMQLAGPEVWGPPRDVNAAIAVLREAIASGVNHIDTSDYYGEAIGDESLADIFGQGHPAALLQTRNFALQRKRIGIEHQNFGTERRSQNESASRDSSTSKAL